MILHRHQRLAGPVGSIGDISVILTTHELRVTHLTVGALICSSPASVRGLYLTCESLLEGWRLVLRGKQSLLEVLKYIKYRNHPHIVEA